MSITVEAAQREMRSVYTGGSVGQLVAGLLWLAAAAASTWFGAGLGIIILVVGGMFIFPMTQLALKAMGRPVSVRRENPLRHLAMQVAFIVPLTLPVAGGAALYNINWFFPACMILVGAHYLPFVFLYGLRSYAVLAACLMGAGMGFGLYRAEAFSPAGWLAGIVLVVFGLATWVQLTKPSTDVTRAG